MATPAGPRFGSVVRDARRGLISAMAINVADLRLVLVTDDAFLEGRSLEDLLRAAVAGGVTAVQVRLKHRSPRELADAVRSARAAVGVPVFVNDRMDVALAAGAAGVHLGGDDLPVDLAREIAPVGFWIGASVGTEAESAAGAGADYWGVGPFRESGTKGDAGAAIGLSGVAAVVARAGSIPCVAIGGIRPEDVGSLLAAGVVGVAVVSGILGAADPMAAARAYRETC